MADLKSCPFCGGSARIEEVSSREYGTGVAVICGQCSAASAAWYMACAQTREMVTHLWNRRVLEVASHTDKA